MPTATDQKQREGEVILWTLLFLAVLARVTEQDLQTAAALWARLAPKASQGLVYAGQPVSRYTWNQDALRYVRPDGQRVKPSAVKQSVNSFVRDAQDELAAKTKQMVSGEVTIEAWQTQMAADVKSIHLATDIVAQGGLKQFDQADMARAEKGIDFQLKRLLDFSREISGFDPNTGQLSDTIIVPDAAAINRARLYAATARSTFEESIAQSWLDLAATGVSVEQRNILAPDADHCQTNLRKGTIGCVEETKRGWVAIGTMTLPGRRTCKSGCACRMDYRRKPNNAINN